MEFYKMQGIGNDYIYVNTFKTPVEDPGRLAAKLSDRHFGIGSDGLILLCPSEQADIKMRMFNADGSEGKMCGNGIRCVAKLAYLLGVCKKTEMKVETLSGIKELTLLLANGEVKSVTVNMGEPKFAPAEIPAAFRMGKIVSEPIEVLGKTYKITCVSMGNPHAVIFSDSIKIDSIDLEKIGPYFEKNSLFPDRINTEFVEILGPGRLKMRVWERGSGETMACGTGACAVAAAACLNGIAKRGSDIGVLLRGGELIIRWTQEGPLYMTGPAELVFTGSIDTDKIYSIH